MEEKERPTDHSRDSNADRDSHRDALQEDRWSPSVWLAHRLSNRWRTDTPLRRVTQQAIARTRCFSV